MEHTQLAAHENNQLPTTTSLPERTLSLLANDRIDWDGRYRFDGNGKIDYCASIEAGCGPVNNGALPMPALTDDGRANIEAARRELNAAMLPPTRDQFAVIITRLSLHCGMQGKHPDAVTMMLEDYWKDFGHYPRTLIENACDKYRRLPEGNSFMPNSGQFIELMKTEYFKMEKMRSRTEKLLGIEKPPEEKPTVNLLDFLKRA